MSVHPQVQMVLERINQSGMSKLHHLPPEMARAAFENLRTPPNKFAPMAKVEDREIESTNGSIPIRIYQPQDSGPLPVLIYFHGGGFVIGSIDSHEGLCRQLAAETECIVVSVGYRLAPEHKFPAAVEDAYAATCWVVEHAAEINADPQRCAVGGDSAGGNLAAVVTHLARDRQGPPLSCQILIYPAVDFSKNYPSYQENGSGYFLTIEAMQWFGSNYIRSPEDKRNPLASPILAKSFSELPPALVITAEYDPLRDEGKAYADVLKKANVPVTYSMYPGMIHGFLSMIGVLDASSSGIQEVANFLKKIWQD